MGPDDLLSSMALVLLPSRAAQLQQPKKGGLPAPARRKSEDVALRLLDLRDSDGGEGGGGRQQGPMRALLPSLVAADPNAFYKDAGFFYKAPAKPQEPRCTCNALCTRAEAVVKCYSCVRFDPQRLGYHCEACFNARHPWYRVPHQWVLIDDADDTVEEVKAQEWRAEADRSVEDLGALLRDVTSWQNVLKTDRLDETGDDLIKAAARGAVRVEGRIRDLMDVFREERSKLPFAALQAVRTEARHLQKAFEIDALKRRNGLDIRTSRRSVDLSTHAQVHNQRSKMASLSEASIAQAASIIQRAWLRYRALSAALALVRRKFKRKFDPNMQAWYYINAASKQSQWKAPPYITPKRQHLLLTPRSFKRENK